MINKKKVEKPKLWLSEENETDVSRLKSESSAMKLLMAGVIVVLFIGFITVLIALAGILLDGWRFHAANYNEFIQTLKTQERIIQSYTEEQKSINEIIKPEE